MSIDNLPPLLPSSPTFQADVDDFFAVKLPASTAQLNVEFERINTLGFGAYTATSTTSLAVSVASKALTIQTGKGFVGGQPVQIARTSDPAGTYMSGVVDSYDSGTGALVVVVSRAVGTGTFTNWTISVTSSSPGSGAEQFVYINQGVI